MRNPAHMPELQDDAATLAMDLLGHLFPALDLSFVENAGRIGVTEAARTYRGRLANDKPGRGALSVVLGIEGTRNIAGLGAATRKRCHENAVRRLDRSKL